MVAILCQVSDCFGSCWMLADDMIIVVKCVFAVQLAELVVWKYVRRLVKVSMVRCTVPSTMDTLLHSRYFIYLYFLTCQLLPIKPVTSLCTSTVTTTTTTFGVHLTSLVFMEIWPGKFVGFMKQIFADWMPFLLPKQQCHWTHLCA